MSIAKFAVHRRVAVSMIALAIVVLGIFALPRLPIDMLPNFTQPVVTVSVTYPNVGPEQMETLITRPIENAVSRVNGIQQINSSSQEGHASIEAQFYFGTNIDTAAVDVQEQVSRIWGTLPNDPNLQQPVITKFDANSLPVVRVFVTDPNMTLRQIGDLFTNQLSDEFSAIDGVAAVTINSDQQRAIMVEPNASTLAADGITLQQIMTRIAQENINLPAGVVQVGQNEYLVRASALLKSAQETGEIIVTTKNGAPIRLNQVAKVTDSILEQRSFQRLNGVPAMGMLINAQPDANVVATSAGVYKKIDQIEKRYPGMKIAVVFEQEGFIREAISALEHTAIYGAILAIAIIFLFLHSWRSTLIVAISLPVSVLGTLFAAYVFGYSLNIMTLGGLALAVGLIVDDAIVVIENIYRHMARGQSPMEAAETATAEIFTAVLASSITVITVFVPLVLIPGLQGLIFTPFAVMVMVAVGLSLVVALTQVPMLSSVLLRRPAAAATNGSARNGAARNGQRGGGYARFSAAFDRHYERFAKGYARVLAWAIDRPGIIVALAVAVLAVTLVATKMGAVQTELFPPSNSRYARFNLQTQTGTAVSKTNAVAADVENRMRKDPRVVDVGAQVGVSGFVSGTPTTNLANLSVTLAPGTSSMQAQLFVSQWTAALTGQQSGRGGARKMTPAQMTQLRERFGAPIPGLQVFGRTVDIVQSIISRGQDALQIQIFGPNISTLYNIAEYNAIPKLQAAIPGLQPPQPGITNSQPEIDVNVNRPLAAQLGIDTATISQDIDIGTAGEIASYMQIDGTQYPIEVQLPPDQRRTLQSIESLSIPVSTVPTGLLVNSATGNGAGLSSVNGSVQLNSGYSATGNYNLQTMPLSELANIQFGVGPSEITRQDKQREIDIDAGLNIPLGQAVEQATKVMNAITLPAGYYWAFGPQVLQQGQTFSSLNLIVALAIVLIFMLLASQFESVIHPLVIMASVPLASAGIVFAIFFRNVIWGAVAGVTGAPFTPMAFGLTAFIGVLMLVGIVVKNAILVVEFTNQLRERGMEARDAVLHAAPMRLRPILMTTLATIGGMLPIALGIEAGSQTQAPLGTVVIGGLAVSTTLSLIVVPTLYLWAARHVEPRLGGFHRGVEVRKSEGPVDFDEVPISAAAD